MRLIAPMTTVGSKSWSLIVLFLVFIQYCCIVHCDSSAGAKDNGNTTVILNQRSKTNGKKGSVLGKCTRCRLLSNSLYENLKQYHNERNNQGFLNSFESLNDLKSAVPFAKIWDKLCFDIKAGRDDCRSLAEDNLELLSSWWSRPEQERENHQDSRNILFDLVCIDALKVCCPDGQYGLNCTPCTGYPNQICSNNGKCAGAGTRLGDGHCICKKAYQGPDCSTCEKAYFLNATMFEFNGTIHCLPCDASCAETCFAHGPRGCHVCKAGFAWDNDYGCYDIDECAPEYRNSCPRNSFCINTEGSYQCYQCDHACDGCDGDGPDSCLKCAEGHVLEDGVCVNPNPKPLIPPYASPARYITYLGLCLVTCIIFRHNIYIASAIGLAVALYIMASERSLDTEYGQAFDAWWKKVSSWNF